MKRFTLFILWLFSITPVFSQGWEEVGVSGSTQKANNNVAAVCYDNGILYVGGIYKDTELHGYVAKWNGEQWEELGTGNNALNFISTPNKICVDKEHNIYVLGQLRTTEKWCVMKWNGATWSAEGAGDSVFSTYKGIYTFCTDKEGNVYVAGALNDTTGRYNVAKWDGTNWQQLGRVSNALNASDVIMALEADSKGYIYAAGEFKLSGNAYVAKWDGISWSNLIVTNNKPNDIYRANEIRALFIDETDNIYAGGEIVSADRNNCLAKWDGTSWIEVDNGNNSLNSDIPGSINVITGDKAGNIYVAGMGIVQHMWQPCVKKWDGISWNEVGIGSTSIHKNERIRSICTDTAGVLYAGGVFMDKHTADKYINVVKFDNKSLENNLTGIEPIHAWPNPAYDVLYIEVDKYDEYYYLYDLRGVLMSKMQNKMSGAATNRMYLYDLAKGTYLLKKQNAAPFLFQKM